MPTLPKRLALGVLLLSFAACEKKHGPTTPMPPVSASNHAFFPIGAGTVHELGKSLPDGTIACESCHPASASSFTEIDCLSCHGHVQTVTDRLHLSLADYVYQSPNCYACHPKSDKVPFDHAQISDDCAMCHDVDTPFAALPKPGFTHPEMGGSDCGSCHHGFTTWETSAPASGQYDPNHDLTVDALKATWSGTSIVVPMTAHPQLLHMTMDHASLDVPQSVLQTCDNCHQPSAPYPGTFHSALANLTVSQPTGCASCHKSALPVDFVGPTATSPARYPASGEMHHDAVAWSASGPTVTRLVPDDCGVCHAPPGVLATGWAAGVAGTSPALFHSALDAAGLPQPPSCIDCHANTRPHTPAAGEPASTGLPGQLDHTNSTLPATLKFDHDLAEAQGDCVSCHQKSTQAPFTSWGQALFHTAGSATPATCSSCHEGERPTATGGWTNTSYTQAPFDYVGSTQGTTTVTHGAGLDCVVCHANPGSGQWGNGQNWAAGHFTHGAGTPSATTCVLCHSTQRPDLVLGVSQANTALGFDHSTDGRGDCFACHQATVTAGTYANYFKSGTSTLPGGDWKNGVPYPGDVPATSTTSIFSVLETKLNRSGANNLVTSSTTTNAPLFNSMLHTATVLPPELQAGPPGMPDNTKCWHCHTHTGTTVTSLSDGKFHTSLSGYSATPGGTVVPFPQPTTGCAECHLAQATPVDIVQKSANDLLPMDHGAQFTAAVTIGGKSVTAVSQLDCSTCHASPGNTWTDGTFHSKISQAQPKDCVQCHWLLMADAAKADVTQATDFAMKHRSAQLTFQACDTCHTQALSKAAMTPAAATLWKTGSFHPSLAAQPGLCVDCHNVSQPLANQSTQSSVVYPFTLGGTATNGGQWMNHGSAFVAGKDCATCHLADAKASGSAWNKADSFHLQSMAAGTCRECHGLTNGGGNVPGTKNNLPNGLTNSSTVTSASMGSGVAGSFDQMLHTDANALGRDCNFCHTQQGVASGSEWAQAKFHPNFNAGTPLLMNGTTARCSNCHLAQKPGPGFAAQDHSTFSAMPGTQDCSSCHAWPGTGTPSAPNWLGASGVPVGINVGGFTVTSPPAASGTLEMPINGLPHPTVAAGVACTTCHASSGGGKNAFGYDHASPLIASQCNACHETGSDLVGTPWNNATMEAAGAGDTRPWTLASVTALHGSNLTVTFANHFYPADCSQCHVTPAGNGLTTTGPAYQAAWSFPHDQSKMANPTTCVMCHVNGIPGAPDGGVSDPQRDYTVAALLPGYSGTSITSLTPQSETLPMEMNHASADVPSTVYSACTNCHLDAASGVYYPGDLHSSLANLSLAEPTNCASCHAGAAPTGFVGPTAAAPPRVPPSPEMKHDAVRWNNGAPTTTLLVTTECSTCHASPSATLAADWTMGKAGTSPATYHPALAAAGKAQPNSCVDCHANTRPSGVLTSANSLLAANLSFDHSSPAALADCQSCHAASTVAPFTSWGGGKYHLAGSATPSTCLPCHASERPTSTTGWASTTYTQAPFDYGTNANAITHGDGLDCVTCHAGPGSGQWGSSQNWVNGHFTHGAGTPSASTCAACHLSQRPDLVLGVSQANTLLSFDHSTNGAGDCFGCHQATVTANTYAHYFNTGTGTLPNGDWKGGVSYPGDVITSSTDQFVTLSTLTLTKSGALVTGMTTSSQTLYNGMLHTSAVLPTQLQAGPTGNPDNTKCWHCHTHTGTTVTSFKNGQYHSSLTTYSATPGGTVVPFPQPTTNCTDCHAQMLPAHVVEKAASDLQPMDHSAAFTGSVNIGGQSVTSVPQIDCSNCHKSPGTAWSDGLFHANIGAAVPADCVMCHYPLLADAAKSDLTSTTNYAMKHRSTQLTFQACATCHAQALSKSTTTSHAATLWQTGALHPSVSPQPASCNECHLVSEPAANASTQSSYTYTLALGGTTTNGAQWHNHGAADVAGKDCSVCHLADAKTSGSAWSKSDQFHTRVPSPTACNVCHGLTNGGGSVAGTKNNLPNGLTNSTMVSSAAGASGTGVPAGTLDQILHTDVNVSAFECSVCHTQKGLGTGAIAGKEWAQAKFHTNFTGTRTLVMNGTTGRCSNCHLNVKPTSAFTAFDHSTFTSASGSQDCSSCHSWPGTGTSTAPNWLGAAGAPQYITVGGFTIPAPPAGSPTTQAGIANLPHPTGSTCTSCHSSSSGGKPATGYDHASTLITSNCRPCHEYGSNLVASVWNGSTTQSGGAGDTRPYTIVGLKPSFQGNTRTLTNGYNHFYGVDCKECHTKPTGVVNASTGSTYTSRWKFKHSEGSPMTKPSTCNMCHGSPNNIPN